MRMRLGKARKSCGFMMEALEQRELLTAAADGVVDPQPAADTVIAADLTQPPLAAPSGVHVTKTFSTSLIVAWTDESASESGHRIQRSSDGVGWNTIGTVGPNMAVFHDTGLAPDTTYYYRVVAFDFLSELPSEAISSMTSSQLLQVGFNASGLSNITYNGTVLLDLATSPQDGFLVYDRTIVKPDGTRIVAGSGGFSSSWDPLTQTLNNNYTWGRVVTQYVQDVDRLNLIITVTNKSSVNTLAGLSILPFVVDFPDFPVGYTFDSPFVGYNIDGPTVIPADWQTGMLALANDDVAKSLYVGFFPYPQTVTDQKYLYWVGSTPWWSQPSSWSRFDRPIAPLGTDQYTVSLRFGPSGATAEQIAPDVFASAQAQFPYQLNWNDRRPIGSIHLANSGAIGSKNNPRGYFGGNFNVFTKAGRETFRKTLMHWANNTIAILKDMNAQGMVVWDLEGEEFANINYVGDPRMLSTLAPEMEYLGAVDAYFKKFRDAGLKVGVAVRGQRLKLTTSGWRQVNVKNPYALLASKIEYARTRWGATLFYVDSNVFKSVFDAGVFKKLLTNYPDILLMPEHETTRYHAYSSPYKELRMDESSTPDSALQAYPTAFSVIHTSAGDFANYHDELVAAVRRGDILMFAAWFNDAGNANVKAIYDEALGTSVL